MTGNNYFIRARILEWESRNEECFPYLSYTVYSVTLLTATSKWTVHRRFNEFFALNQILQSKGLSVPFPSKVLFKNNDYVIEHRKSALENYLNYVFNVVDLTSYPEILDFIGVSKDKFMIYASVEKLYKSPKKKPLKFFSEECLTAASSLDSTDDSSGILLDFLKDLNSQPSDRINTLTEFESKFHEDFWSSLGQKQVKLLFFGNSLMKGLVSFIDGSGDLAEKALIRLIARLIDFEVNPNCEDYREALAEAGPDLLGKAVFLKQHADNKNYAGQHASNILKVLQSNVKTTRILY